MEEWKDILDFPGYKISSHGNVINKSGKVMSGGIIETSDPNLMYRKVNLVKDKKPHTIRVHRLVAQAFIPNPDNKPEIDHINRDGCDNRVENLRWASRSENAINTRDRMSVSGHRHICLTPEATWRVKIRRANCDLFDNCFKDLEEAIAARDTFFMLSDPLL
jgi:hypothetical protein